jgi:DNA-binding MarR family transcriptional regulator
MKRRCRREGCGAYLRQLNPGPLCDPCAQTATDAHLAEMRRADRRPMTVRVLEALQDGPGNVIDLAERLHLSQDQVERTVNHLVRTGQAVSSGRRGNQTMGRTRVYSLAAEDVAA